MFQCISWGDAKKWRKERSLCHLYLLGNSFNEFWVGIIAGDRRQYATWVAWGGGESEDRQTGNVAKLAGKRETVQKSAVLNDLSNAFKYSCVNLLTCTRGH